MVSHPETGSDSPIGSDRDRGCDTLKLSNVPLGGMHQSTSFMKVYGIEDMFPLGGMHQSTSIMMVYDI